MSWCFLLVFIFLLFIYNSFRPRDAWSPFPKTTPRIHNFEKRPREIKLEQSGDINTLQRYRYKTHRDKPMDDQDYYSSQIIALLSTEQDLRHFAQEEVFVRDLPGEPEESKTRLRKINRTLWGLKRKWWKHRTEFGQGVLSRAFDLWRSNPLWYMHEVLVEDCAQKQGCCARGCGCCEKRQKTSTRHAAGHCALTCGCCRKHRGFELTPEEEEDIHNEFDLDDDGDFYERIELASIWGLRLNFNNAPNDLIKLQCGLDYAGNSDDDLLGFERSDDEDDFSLTTVSS
ncbi:unnamed protein product [Penicillium salamii]|uniref:Uncharacterized protein n=1 Tax=Penicillium salamii TaxID=1612424 RepID=A0A9W4NKY0_9EURO|nr:unnamed protein product [Penicillium salamii]CAG8252112.1 unnamed protein product [Penicillium salamii]CAG8279577.1 unnamed protein product [Penicillium salamii]CAG8382307.1 unnamed protein product [Penicillium salamii]CAG8386918.1 unnamed protein product [Penicillium salamii]